MSDETMPESEIVDVPQIDSSVLVLNSKLLEGEEAPEKLDQIVDIKDAGPCKKHIKVTVQRAQIDEQLPPMMVRMLEAHLQTLGQRMLTKRMQQLRSTVTRNQFSRRLLTTPLVWHLQKTSTSAMGP